LNDVPFDRSDNASTTDLALGEIRFIEALIHQAQADPEVVLVAAGLPRDLFQRGDDEAVPLPAFFGVMEHLTDAAHDETVTASARPLRPGTAQLVLAGVAHGASLAQAMVHIAHAYNVVHDGDYNRVVQRPDRLVYVIDDHDFPFAVADLGETRHAFMESVLVFLHALLSELSSAPLTTAVLRVETRRASRASGGAFLKYLRAPVRYGAPHYAIHYAPQVGQAPVREFSATAFNHAPVYRVVAQRIAAAQDEAPTAMKWRDWATATLRAGAADQTQAAAEMGLSVAGLRRRLTDENTTFRDVKAAVRDERAKHLLACGHTVREVAELLSYSDTRSFSRAFKTHNGVTPSAYQDGLQDVSKTQR